MRIYLWALEAFLIHGNKTVDEWKGGGKGCSVGKEAGGIDIRRIILEF